MKTKLFIWEDALSDYHDGIAFAYAESIDEARRLILDKYCTDYARDRLGKGKPSQEMISYIKKELEYEPKIIITPEGFYLFGGSG